MKLADHPTVRAYKENRIDSPKPPAILESEQLKQMALASGADDAGFIDLARDALADYRQDLLDATYHFTFTGNENLEGTVTIKEKKLAVLEGLVGKPDLHVTADSHTWAKFLAKEINLVKALVTRKIKIKGSPKLMLAFAKCFPS